MSPRPLPGVVFITGVVLGSVISFVGIQMLSSSSLVFQKVDGKTGYVHHLMREIDVDLLCNISRKSVGLEKARQSTDSPILNKQRLSRDSETEDKEHKSSPISHEEVEKQVVPKGEIHFADEHQHNGKCFHGYIPKALKVIFWVKNY